ncbi:MAG: PRC-barrel domain-containing protein [bacterium]|nr:PRC-barrel domain-containing protein [bacterium]
MDTAEAIGHIDGFVVDPQTSTIVALAVKKAAEGDTLEWSSINSFGVDAVTVSDAGAVGNASSRVQALLGKDHGISAKRVLTTQGDEIGTVSDVEFDPASGRIDSLVLQGRDVDGERIVGIGSYAVVVHDIDGSE